MKYFQFIMQFQQDQKLWYIPDPNGEDKHKTSKLTNTIIVV